MASNAGYTASLDAIVGKVRLRLSPPQNHFWHTALYVSERGLTTSPIPFGSELFQVEFDFREHQLLIATTWSRSARVALGPGSVADFYTDVMSALRGLGIDVEIWTTPVEMADRIPFEHDTVHASYDPAAAHAFWRALIQVHRVFERFRGRFLGKCSPVHFFWGSFDLAVTRFSGRRAPLWTGSVVNVHPHVMHESYSHELGSAGFWPGGSGASPMFYSYAVPEPTGFSEARVGPAGTSYNSQLREFVLPYDAVRLADQPDDALRDFLESTYAAAANLGAWDRVLLEHRPPCHCRSSGADARTSQSPTDERLVQHVVEELADDPHLDTSNVRVHAENGTIILAGSVPSESQRLAAERYAWWVDTVRAVENQLVVDQQRNGRAYVALFP
jgi:Family of unknown function (DUF5996)/BON domain